MCLRKQVQSLACYVLDYFFSAPGVAGRVRSVTRDRSYAKDHLKEQVRNSLPARCDGDPMHVAPLNRVEAFVVSLSAGSGARALSLAVALTQAAARGASR